jgi:tRNA(Arg) A34 adenosine deaminase TadA
MTFPGGNPKWSRTALAANVTGGILEEECRQLMQDFFREKR